MVDPTLIAALAPVALQLLQGNQQQQGQPPPQLPQAPQPSPIGGGGMDSSTLQLLLLQSLGAGQANAAGPPGGVGTPGAYGTPSNLGALIAGR